VKLPVCVEDTLSAAGGAILATKDVVLLPTAVNPGPSTI
jgi:hypothetical protein